MNQLFLAVHVLRLCGGGGVVSIYMRMSWFICMSRFSDYTLRCFLSIISHMGPVSFLCLCLHMHAYRCTRLCLAAANAVITSGGSSLGPFVPSIPWTTCQLAERESKAARSGQWAGSAWHTARLALQNTTGIANWHWSCSWHAHWSWHLPRENQQSKWTRAS